MALIICKYGTENISYNLVEISDEIIKTVSKISKLPLIYKHSHLTLFKRRFDMQIFKYGTAFLSESEDEKSESI